MLRQAVIFDMDGVLFDTEEFYYRRRQHFLADKGISILHLPVSFFIGGNMKQVWQAILGDDYIHWDIEKLQTYYALYKQQHPLPYKNLLFSDVKRSLERLRNARIRIALASSSSPGDIALALEEAEIKDYFELTLSGEEFPESKPHPAIYNEAARLLALPKDALLIIEDSEKGIAAGRSAEIEVWGIKDERFGLNQSQANHLVSNLTQAVEELLMSKRS